MKKQHSKLKYFFFFIITILTVTNCVSSKSNRTPIIASGAEIGNKRMLATNYLLPVWPFPVGDSEQRVKGNNMYINVDIKDEEDIISRTDFYSIPSMILKEVKMTFKTPLSGQVRCYAAYSKYGDLYVAERDLSNNIVFVKHYKEDDLSFYDKHIFLGSNNTYCCTAFEKLGTIDPATLKELDVTFTCMIMAENGDTQGITFEFDK